MDITALAGVFYPVKLLWVKQELNRGCSFLYSHVRKQARMPALFPMMAAPEHFRPGDVVRKFVSERAVSPYVGVVTHLAPAACKVWVQWPVGSESESPETLVKVNPAISGMPTALQDMGYSSYEKTRSERRFGPVPLAPKRASSTDKMAIRIAHDFASGVVGRLVDEICACSKEGLDEVHAYDRAWRKFGSMCSDHIVRMSVEKIYRK